MAPANAVRSRTGRIVTIKVPKPQSGESITVQSRPGANLLVDFDPLKAALSRSGNDLVLTFEDGGVIVLARFFVVGGSPLPYMTMPDGMVVSSVELFASADFDTSTARAPSRPAQPPRPAGSGMGEYRNERGELVDSVEKLESGQNGDSGALSGATGSSFRLLNFLTLTPDSGYRTGNPNSGGSATPPDYSAMDLTDSLALALNESGTARGTRAGTAETGHVIGLPEGYRLDTTGWTEDNGLYTTEQGNFRLLYSAATNELRYDVIDAFDHPDPDSPHEELAEAARISLVLIGPDGGRIDAHIDVQVLDDAPEAGITSGYEQLRLSEGGSATGSLDVAFGADGEHAVSPVEVSCGGVQGVLQSDGLTYVFDGIGSLKMEMDADGNYSGAYTFTAGTQGVYELVFRITDADGDSVTVGPVNVNVSEPGTLDFTDPAGPDLHEGGLSGGTTAGEPVSHSVSLGEEYSLDLTGWTSKGGDVYTSSQGNFSLSYNSATKVLTYTLIAPFDHPDADANHEPLDEPAEISFTVLDSGGLSYDAYIRVQVLDDSPAPAVPSSYAELSGLEGSPVSGKVQLHFGADGPSDEDSVSVTCDGVAGVLQGDGVTLLFEGLGSMVLVMDASGAYTGGYSFTPMNPGEYTLEFTVKDADGDIGICGPVTVLAMGEDALDISDPSASPLEEKGLPGGSMEGGAPTSHSLTLPDGYSLDTSGWDVSDSLFVKDYAAFNLVYDPETRTLTYELVSPLSHPDPLQGNELLDQPVHIPLKLVHETEGERDAYIAVDVRDDAPGLAVGTGLESLFGYENVPVEGAILVSFGADGPAETGSLGIVCTDAEGRSVTGASRDGLSFEFEGIGVIVMEKDADGYTGRFTFTPSATGDYTFTFTGTDMDGDSAGASVAVRVSDETLLDLNGGETAILEEAGLAGGTLEGSGTIRGTVAIPEGYTLDTAGWTEASGGVFSTIVQNGSIRLDYISASGLLAYTLLAPHTHSDPTQAHELLDNDIRLDFTLIHPEEGARDAVLHLNIRDDAPEIGVPEGYETLRGTAGESVTGSYGVKYGADGAHATAPLLIECNGVQGLTEDGVTYVFSGLGTLTLIPGAGGSGASDYVFIPVGVGEYSLKFTAYDQEGDSSSVEVLVSITEFPPLDLSKADAPPLEESGLPGGSGQGSGLLEDSISLPDGYTVDTGGWTDEGGGKYSLVQADGRLLAEYDSAAGTITYRLTGRFDHPDSGSRHESLASPAELRFIVTDANGDSYNAFIQVDVLDDAPVLSVPDGERNLWGSSGESIEGSLDLSFGADGPASGLAFGVSCVYADDSPVYGISSDGLTYVFAGLGTLVMEADANGLTGNYTFTPQNNGGYTLSFMVTDADGDSAYAQVNIDALGPADVILTDPDADPLEERALSYGTTPDEGKLSHTVFVPLGYELDLTGWGEVTTSPGSYSMLVEDNRLLLIYNTVSRTLTYTLTAGFMHPDPEQAHEALAADIRLSLKVTHALYGDGEAILHVNVLDDAPIVLIPEGMETLTGMTDIPVAGAFELYIGGDGPSDPESYFGFYILKADGTMVEPTILSQTEFTFDGIGSLELERVGGVYTGGYTFTGTTEGLYRLIFFASDADGDIAGNAVSLVVTGDGTLDLTDPAAAPLEEKGLPNGTDPDNGNVLGSVALPYGYSLDTSDWVENASFPGMLVLPQADGKITLVYNPATPGQVYYRLTGRFDHSDPESANEGLDEKITLSFTLVHDVFGERTALVDVDVLDDAPIMVIPDGYESLTGQMGDSMQGAFELYLGGDGPAASDNYFGLYIETSDGTIIEPTVLSETEVVFEGIGSLTLERVGGVYTGFYTFTGSAPGTYRLIVYATDADGDISGQGVSLTVLDEGALDLTDPAAAPLEEKGLPNGTDPDNGNVLGSVALPEGYSLDTTGWGEDSRFPGMLVLPQVSGKILLLYNPATPGQVYYRLAGRFDHPDPENPNEGLAEKITLAFKVVDENEAVRDAFIEVDVLDDAPLVVIPSGMGNLVGPAGTAIEGAFELYIGGDGPADPTAYFGLYIRTTSGTRVEPTVLSETEFLFEGIGLVTLERIGGIYTGGYTFTGTAEGVYQLVFFSTDADGDVGGQAVSLTVLGAGALNLTDPNAAPLEEKGLPNGTDPDNGNVLGSVALPEGYSLDTTGWVENASFPGMLVLPQADGNITLVYNPTTPGRVYYRLTGRFDHPDPASAHEGLDAKATLAFRIVDESEAVRDAYIEVDVLDDAPVVIIPSGMSNLTGLAGTVMQGAFELYIGGDGPSESSSYFGLYIMTTGGTRVEPTVLSETEFLFDGVGLVTLERVGGVYTGNYTFTGSAAGVYQLIFFGTDADGDSGGQAVSLTVLGEGALDLTDPNAAPLEEKGLPNGTDPDNGNVLGSVALPEGYSLDTTGWVENAGYPGMLVLPQADGNITLVYNPATPGRVYYRLTGRFDHPDPASAHEGLDAKVTLAFRIVDESEAVRDAYIEVDVLDDAPVVVIPSGMGALTGLAGTAMQGAFELYIGGDGPSESSSYFGLYIMTTGGTRVEPTVLSETEFLFDGVGLVTLERVGGVYTGNYTFTGSAAGVYQLIFFGTDADGDSGGQAVSLTVLGAGALNLTDPNAAPLEEKGLPNGTDPDNGNVLGSVALPEGYSLDTTGWVENAGFPGMLVLPQADGNITLVYNPATPGRVYYRLTGRFDHPDPDSPHEGLDAKVTLAFKIVDESEAVRDAYIEVDVLDDAPIVLIPEDMQLLSGQPGAPITGAFELYIGGDGPSEVSSYFGLYIRTAEGTRVEPTVLSETEVFFEGIGGLTLERIGGVYTGGYTFTPMTAGEYTLVFFATDADGDISGAGVRVVVGGDVPQVDLTDPNAPDLYESGLADGSDPGALTGYYINLAAVLAQGYELDLDGWDNPSAGVYTTVQDGFRLTYNADDAELRYDLVEALEHDQPGNDLSKEAQITLSFGNSQGDEIRGIIKVTVLDDAPGFGPDQESAALIGESVSGSVAFSFGADGMAASDGLVLLHDGTTYRPGQDGKTFTLRDGSTLVMDTGADGLFTGAYTFTPANSGRYELTLTATDADGDTDDFSLVVQADYQPESVGSVLLEEDGTRIASIPLTQAGLTGLSWDLDSLPLLQASPDNSSPYAQVQWKVDAEEGSLFGYILGGNGEEILVLALYPELERADPQIRVELLRPVMHSQPAGSVESEKDVLSLPFRFTAESASGEARLELEVTVRDSVPQANDDRVILDDQVTEVYGNLISGDYVFNSGGPAGVSGDSDQPGQDGSLSLTRVRLPGGQWVELAVQGSDRDGVAFALLTDANGNSIKVYADGEYVLGVADASLGSIRFEYSVTDKDGDRSSAMFEAALEGRETVDLSDSSADPLEECALPGGTDGNGKLSHDIDLSAKLPQGYSLDVTGWTDSGSGVHTTGDASGKFSLQYDSNTGILTYTLIESFAHGDPAAGNESLDRMAEIYLKLAHASEASREAVIRVQVLDDAPRITAEAGPQPEGDVGTAITLPLTVIFGGDGPADADALRISCAVEGGRTVSGVLQADGITYVFAGMGTLVADVTAGSYVFTPEAAGEYSFTFVAKDADNDQATGTLTLTATALPLEDVDLTDPAAPDLFESGLTGGTNPNATTAHSIDLTDSLPAGYSPDVSGWTADGSGVYSSPDASGNFSLRYDSATGVLTYTLIKAFAHSDTGEAHEPLENMAEIRLDLVHATEAPRAAFIKVQVLDDAPLVTVDTRTVPEGETGSAIDLPLEIVFGGDGPAGSSPLTVRCLAPDGRTVTGVLQSDGKTYEFAGVGRLVVEASSSGTSYSFVALAGGEHVLGFTALDADGDSASGEVTVNVTAPGRETVDLTVAGSPELEESGLEGGSSPGAAISHFINLSASLPAGYDVDVSGWTESPSGVFSQQLGNFKLTYLAAEKELTYELAGPLEHTGGGDEKTESVIRLPLVNGGGEYMDGLITVVVVDDEPDIGPSPDAGGPQGAVSGFIDLVYGADSMHADSPLTVSYAGASYSLAADGLTFVLGDGSRIVMEKDGDGVFTGNYTFTSGSSGRKDYALTFTAMDGDGDTAAATVTVHAGVTATPPAESVSFAEDSLPASKTVSIAQDTAIDGLVWQVDRMPDLHALDVDGVERQVEWQVDGESNTLSGIVRSASGEASTILIVYDESSGTPPSVMAQLLAPVQHQGAVQGRDILGLEIPFSLSTEWGDLPVSLAVAIQDSMPSAVGDSITLAPGVDSVEGDVIAGLYSTDGGASTNSSGAADSTGMDAPASIAGVRLAGAGSGEDWALMEEGGFDAALSLSYVEVGATDGSVLRVYENGQYTFSRGQGSGGNLFFEYILRDADGDESRASLSFLIEGMEPVNLTEGMDIEAEAVFESGLEGGSAAGAVTSRAIDLTGVMPEGYVPYNDDWVEQPAGVFTYDDVDEPFRLVYSEADNRLTYELVRPVVHSDPLDPDELLPAPHVILLQFSDGQGNVRDAYIEVQVRDDAPVIDAGNGTPLEVGVGGQVALPLEVVFGGDGPAESASFAVGCRTSQGTLVQGVLQPDGMSYLFEGVGLLRIDEGTDGNSYFFSGLLAGDYSLVFSAVDTDGDSSAPTEIAVSVTAPVLVGDIAVDEQDFAEGFIDITQDPPITGLTWHTDALEGLGLMAQAELDGNYLPVQWMTIDFENMLIGYVVDDLTGDTVEVLRIYGDLNEEPSEQYIRAEIYAALRHPAPSGGQESDDAALSLPLSFTASRDSAADLALSVTLNVKDSVPTAADDLVTVSEADREIHGNVISSHYRSDSDVIQKDSGGEDTLGQDGPNSISRVRLLDAEGNGEWLTLDQSGSDGVLYALLEGTWGSIEIHENGEYILNLRGALPRDLVIEYSLEDAEGDRSQAQLTFRAPLLSEVDFTDISAPVLSEGGLNGGSGTAVTAHEISLAENMPEGFSLDTEGWRQSRSGIFTTTTADKLFNLSYDSDSGTLAYELAGSLVHDEPLCSVRIELSLVDAGGNKRTGCINVVVQDDQPAPDISGHDSLQGMAGSDIAGFVGGLFGADGPAGEDGLRIVCTGPDGTAVTGQSADGVTFTFAGLGTVRMLLEDGQYTGAYVFTPAGAGGHGLQFFSRDADGDEGQSGTIAVQVEGLGPVSASLTADEGAGGKTYSAGIALPDNVTDPQWDLEAIPSITACPHGDGDYSELSWSQDAAGVLTGTAGGQVVIRVTPDFRGADSTLTASVSGGLDHGDAEKLSLALSLTLKSGGQDVPVSLRIDITDSDPSLAIQGSGSLSGQEGDAIQGSLAIDFGADGPAGNGVFPLSVKVDGVSAPTEDGIRFSIEGVGVIVMAVGTDGQYTGAYTFTPELEGQYSLVFTATDADGDSTDSGAVTVTVGSSLPASVNLTDAGAEALSESFLSGGSGQDPYGSAVSHAVSTQGYSVDTSDGWRESPAGSGVYLKEQGPFSLEYSSDDGSITYTLISAVDHSGLERDSAAARISLALKDEHGRDVEGHIDVKIRDDVPVLDIPAENRSYSVEEGESITGVIDLHYGADSVSTTQPFAVSCNHVAGAVSVSGDVYTYSFGALGSLEIRNPAAQDGRVEYTFTPAAEGSYSLDFQVTDSEGDSTYSPSVSITVSGGSKPPEPELVELDVQEKFAGNWLYLTSGAPAEASAITWDISAMPSLMGRDPSSGGAYSAVIWEQGANGVLYGKLAGGFTVITVEPGQTGAAGNFRLKIDGSLQHVKDGGNVDNLELPLNYSYENSAGQEADVSIVLRVADSLPSIGVADTGLVTTEGTVSSSLNLDFGADGAALSGAVTATCNGKAGTLSSDGSRISFTDGSSIEFQRDASGYTGEYSFTAASTGQYELRFTITDADGDSVQSDPVAVSNAGSEKLLLGQAVLDESIGYTGTTSGSSQAEPVTPDMLLSLDLPDGVQSYEWDLNTLPAWESLDDSTGEWKAITWSIDPYSGGLVGGVETSYGSSISVSLDTETGQILVSLLRPLRHAEPQTEGGSERDVASGELNIVFQTDDGPVEAVFVLNIRDDSPVIESPEWGGPFYAGVNEVVEGNLGLLFGADEKHAETPLEVYCNGVKGELTGSYGEYTVVFEGLGELELTLDEPLFGLPAQPSLHYIYTAWTAGEHKLVFVARDGDGDCSTSEPVTIIVSPDVPRVYTLELDEATLATGSNHENMSTSAFWQYLEPPTGAGSIQSISIQGMEAYEGLLALNSATGKYEPLTWEYSGTEIKGWVGDHLALSVVFDLQQQEVSGTLHTSFMHDSFFSNTYTSNGVVTYADARSLLFNFTLTGLTTDGEPMEPVDAKLCVKIIDDEPQISVDSDQLFLEGTYGDALEGSINIAFGADGAHASNPVEVYCDFEKGAVSEDGTRFTFSNGVVVEMERDPSGAYTGDYTVTAGSVPEDGFLMYLLEFSARDQEGDVHSTSYQQVSCYFMVDSAGGRSLAAGLSLAVEDPDSNSAESDPALAVASGSALDSLPGESDPDAGDEKSYAGLVEEPSGSLLFGEADSGGNTVFTWKAEGSEDQPEYTGGNTYIQFDLDGDKLYFEDLFSSEAGLQELMASQAVDISADESGKLMLTVYNQEVTLDIGQGALSDQQVFSINSGDMDEKYALLQQVLVSTVGH